MSCDGTPENPFVRPKSEFDFPKSKLYYGRMPDDTSWSIPPRPVKPVTHYIGITYPHIFRFHWVHWLWKLINCRRGMHLWDEVWSPDNHYLFCDACEKRVGIEDGWRYNYGSRKDPVYELKSDGTFPKK
jgi:hypothetical protein